MIYRRSPLSQRSEKKKCSHKWTIGMQDFMQYPKIRAEYICLKCKERKTEWYGTLDGGQGELSRK
jgi:hypothetical protein